MTTTTSHSPAPNDKILWIDCEMTGLRPYRLASDPASFVPDRILEIAAIVTDKDLNYLDDGIELVVQTDKDVLDGMNEWCVAQHGKTGLTAQCQSDSAVPMTQVDERVAAYVRQHFPDGMALLAGNSVHADKAFLVKDLPRTAALLHYRILDVSSLKELVRRWYPEVTLPRKEDSEHRALSDIQKSIRELQHYRQNMMRT